MASENKTTDAALRQIFRAMEADQAQEIREAYYKAVEGLMTRAEALEIADSQQPVGVAGFVKQYGQINEAFLVFSGLLIGSTICGIGDHQLLMALI
ncbi:MAG: hypothetical protein R3C56_35290 [Pirellulaceae bacterium]